MKFKYILLLLTLLLFVSSCAPDPRKEAEAYETRSQADQAAANTEQARRFAQDQHNYEMLKEAYWQNVWNSAIVTVKVVTNAFVISVGIALFGLVLSVAYTTHKTTRGVGVAIERAAIVKANLIYVDAKTGQFPMFLYEGHGRYSMVLPGVAGAVPLDTRHEPDRQMIATQGAALQTWLLAREAAKSQDPAGVSVISPQSVDVTQEMTDYHKLLSEIYND